MHAEVPAVEVSFIHEQHLRADLHLHVKYSALPKIVVLPSTLLPRHVYQLGAFFVILVTFSLLNRGSFVSFFLGLLGCEELTFEAEAHLDCPDTVLPDRVALWTRHHVIDEHLQLCLNNCELALERTVFPFPHRK